MQLEPSLTGSERRPQYFNGRPQPIEMPTAVPLAETSVMGSPLWNSAFNASACFSPMNLGLNSPMNFHSLGSPGGPLLLANHPRVGTSSTSVSHQNSPTPQFYQMRAPEPTPLNAGFFPPNARSTREPTGASVAGSAFHQSGSIVRSDGTPSPLFSYSMNMSNNSPLMPGSPQIFSAASNGIVPRDSLRRSLLIRQQEASAQSHMPHGMAMSMFRQHSPAPISRSNSTCSVSSGDDSSVNNSQTTRTVPSKTPLPERGITDRIDPRHRHHYETLVFKSLYGPSSPLDRIRVWVDPNGVQQFDCVCGKRVPNPSLHKVKRHAYRHAVTSYTCDLCGKVFKAHWSLNAHKRIHKIE